ncbi:uncharacterized protein MYCFIDRAFT_178721 [Pseudocercospora fijiensis CIRAD86]|uniref:2EXR domain-containing protein n=1 Tax=Pseudocercospora fijiensis (strain CIRAD86) TaxID=383855 RepID=M2YLI2_PSEFD|nr:uncharacterized protein MYCFIDRAFT_178721 [Pseudocercospora fijiensis CIRAD86]EME78600.1 hypothetical protein MYCFIDRAFT_178721 [Pseudocercospora fijiensis CIRAD86]
MWLAEILQEVEADQSAQLVLHALRNFSRLDMTVLTPLNCEIGHFTVFLTVFPEGWMVDCGLPSERRGCGLSLRHSREDDDGNVSITWYDQSWLQALLAEFDALVHSHHKSTANVIEGALSSCADRFVRKDPQGKNDVRYALHLCTLLQNETRTLIQPTQIGSSQTRDCCFTIVMASTTPGRIGLFDLPPELRNEIYAYALAEDKPVEVDRSDSPRKPPALLRICRQVYHEAWPIFYRVNIFQTDCYNSAEVFLGGLSDKALSSLRCLRATNAQQSRLAKFMTGWWISFVKTSLEKLHVRGGRRKVSADALFMPMPVGSTYEVNWVTSAQIPDFVIKSEQKTPISRQAKTPLTAAEDSLSDVDDGSDPEDSSDASSGSDGDGDGDDGA